MANGPQHSDDGEKHDPQSGDSESDDDSSRSAKRSDGASVRPTAAFQSQRRPRRRGSDVVIASVSRTSEFEVRVTDA